MANVTFRKGIELNLPTSGMAEEGCVYLSTDTGNMYVGGANGALVPLKRTPYYGTCSTAADTNSKVVALDVEDDNFSLYTGAMIAVRFGNANTVSAPTLNVNGTGAVAAKEYGTTAVGGTEATSWSAGEVVVFVYDGSYWMRVGDKTDLSPYENVQSDWEQDDNTADDYVKNRPMVRKGTNNGDVKQGLASEASGGASHAEGVGTYALGSGSHAEGAQNIARGLGSHAEGNGTTASGSYSHAEGYGTTSTSSYTVSGAANTKTYTTSAAHGLQILSVIKYGNVYTYVTQVPDTTTFKVQSTLSSSEALDGVNIQIIKGIALSNFTHTEGQNCVAVGTYSHAEGRMTTAFVGSHSEGHGARAENACTHAEGMYTVASGEQSHAEGNETKASGESSHAEGEYTMATALASHAEGGGCVASGRYSHAEGNGTQTQNQGEHAEGNFNMSSQAAVNFGNAGNTQHSIGIGTGNNDRKNAVEVMQSGDMYVYGVGGYDGTNYSDADTLQESLSSITEHGANLVPVTYSELVALRDAGTLVAGTQYRITDFVTTSVQEDTQSAGHPFDVIVVADSETVLNENARAAHHATVIKTLHEEETNIFRRYPTGDANGLFAWAHVSDSTDESIGNIAENAAIYTNDIAFTDSEIPTIGSVADNGGTQNTVVEVGDPYFYTSDLASWELKYSLDNDTNRFAWADDENGTGVIFYMKDEWNNECPYDFKNIMFKRWAVTEVTDSVLNQDTVDALNEIFVFDGSDNSKFQARFGYQENNCNYGSTTHVVDAEDSGWYYTFSIIMNDVDSGEFAIDNIEDGSIKGNNFYNDEDGGGFHGNSMKPRYNNMASDEGGIDGAQVLNNIVFNGYYENSEEAPYIYACFMNHLGGNCYDNTFGNYCYNNSFGNNCYQNSFGNSCGGNSFGNDCYYNSFGNDCYYNSFGNYCYNNSFGNNCQNNTFGNNCYYNSFGNYCNNNSFGNNCQYINFRTFCRAIIVDSNVRYCDVTGGTSSNYVQNAYILAGTNGTSNSSLLTISFVSTPYYTQFAALKGGGGTPQSRLVIWNATIQPDWNVTDTNSKAYIKNKPNLSVYLKDIYIPTTYSDLKSLRDGGGLKAGCFYRITDYECTTSQAHTRSAGHKFDIIVQALSADTLSEEAKAIQHIGFIKVDDGSDTYLYKRYPQEDGAGDYAWAYVIDSDNKEITETTEYAEVADDDIIYFGSEIPSIGTMTSMGDDDVTVVDVGDPYFHNSKLESWELKYCFDNDTERFAWAFANPSVSSNDIDTLKPTFESLPSDVVDWIELNGYDYSDSTVSFWYFNTINDKRYYYFTPDGGGSLYSELVIFLNSDASYSVGQNVTLIDSINHNTMDVILGSINGSDGQIANDESFFYKTRIEAYSDQVDHDDKMILRGTITIDGETYYKWRKYEHDGATAYYVLTNTADFSGASLSNPIDGIVGEVYINSDETFGYTTFDNRGDQIVEFHAGSAGSAAGKGVVYYMKDEWNNECPYDFKNIQFKRWKAYWIGDGTSSLDRQYCLSRTYYDGDGFNGNIFEIADDDEFEWRYTFHCKDSSSGSTEDVDATMICNNEGDCICHGNVIKEAHGDYDEDCLYSKIYLNDIVFANTYGGGGVNVCADNRFDFGCFNMHFMEHCYGNRFGFYNRQNIFGNNCINNTFENDCSSNTFGNYCNNNSFGNNCSYNTFGNVYGKNSFGNRCRSNTFGDDCYNNTFENLCQYITFGDDCSYNTFGNYCQSISFGNNCSSNHFNTSCSSIQFGQYCMYNSFGSKCSHVYFGRYCCINTFFDKCDGITFGNQRTRKDYYQYIIVESGNYNIRLNCTATTSASNYYQNVKIAQGVHNTTSDYKTIEDSNVNQSYQTVYQPADSRVVSV